MSNDPNNRAPGGWPPPPTIPQGAPSPYGHAQPQPQPNYQAPQYPPPQYPAQYPAPQYPAPQAHPQPPPGNPYAPNPYAQQPIQVVVQNQMQQPYPYAQQPYYGYPQYVGTPLKKDTALLLCLLGFFFGINGMHRFYLRQPGLGILWFLTGGVCLIGQIIDAVQLLSMSQPEFDRRYNFPQLPR